jgi:hypothetical protein
LVKMSGLLGGGIGNGSGVGPVGFADGPAEEDETPNVSPEEQKQYDLFVENGMELLYTPDGQPHPEVLKRLSTGNKPIDTLAQTTVWLVTILEQDATRNNAPIDSDVLFHGARELMEQLIDLAEAAGIHTFKEAEIQGAWYQALDMYREANSDEGGRFNKDEAAAEFEALNEADKEGRADEVLPGFERFSEQGIAMAMQDQNDPDAEDEGTKRLNSKDTGQ